MQRVQTKTISWIHSLLRVTCPGDDVTGNEQLGNSEAGDAAFVIVGREHGGAEEMLVYSDAHRALAFQSFFRQFAFIDLGNFLQFAPAETSQQPFAFKSKGFGVILEITPDIDLAFRSMRHSLDTASLQFRIEPRKIVEFQR